MEVMETIRRLVGGLADGNVPMECLSTDFGIQEGRSLQEWLAHEGREFEMRRQGFGIDAETLSIRVDHHRQPGRITFSVMGAQGQVAYQDTWSFDDAGRMIGNGSRFETVAKLHFDASGSPLRALAVRSAKGSIVSVVPIGVAASEAVLNQGMRADEDGFATFTMAVENDDLRGFGAKFRIADDAGVRSTEAVWMRGVDEAGFTHGLFPRIDGRSVIVPGQGPSWSLSVVLSDGSTQCVDHPQPGIYEFDAAVGIAILTDALDNDWRSSAQ
jgi:hypothetical protein